MTDVLGIYSYDDDRGLKWFRVRGYGPACDRLYTWLATKVLARQWDDFPWHGFTFENPRDAANLVVLFAEHYLGHDAEVHETSEPEPLDPAAQALNEAIALDFQAAITAEINREILGKLGIPSR